MASQVSSTIRAGAERGLRPAQALSIRSGEFSDRQIKLALPAGFIRRTSGAFAVRGMVHHDDVAGMQLLGEYRPNADVEDLALTKAVDDEGRKIHSEPGSFRQTSRTSPRMARTAIVCISCVLRKSKLFPNEVSSVARRRWREYCRRVLMRRGPPFFHNGRSFGRPREGVGV